MPDVMPTVFRASIPARRDPPIADRAHARRPYSLLGRKVPEPLFVFRHRLDVRPTFVERPAALLAFIGVGHGCFRSILFRKKRERPRKNPEPLGAAFLPLYRVSVRPSRIAFMSFAIP